MSDLFICDLDFIVGVTSLTPSDKYKGANFSTSLASQKVRKDSLKRVTLLDANFFFQAWMIKGLGIQILQPSNYISLTFLSELNGETWSSISTDILKFFAKLTFISVVTIPCNASEFSGCNARS